MVRSSILAGALCAALLGSSSLPARAGCGDQIDMDLRVEGQAAAGGLVTFVVNFAPPGQTLFLTLSWLPGETNLGFVHLCTGLPLKYLQMLPPNPDGVSQFPIPIPPSLPLGFQATLYAQAFAFGSPRSFATTTSSNPVNVEVWAPAVPPIVVAGITPAAGSEGDLVTITGSGFGLQPSQVTVWFDGFPVPPAAVSDSAIQLLLPHLPANGELPVSVQVGLVRSNAPNFTFSKAQVFDGDLVPGWASLTFTDLEALYDPGLPLQVAALGGRIAWSDWAIASVNCVVQPGTEDLFLASIASAAGTVTAERVRFSDEDGGMGDSNYPNDPGELFQWNLALAGGPCKTGPTGITLAVLDSGVYYSDPAQRVPHRDLVGRLTLINGVKLDLIGDDEVPDDSTNHGHGTAVIGTAAAVVHNGLDLSGASIDGRLLPIRLKDTKSHTDALLAKAITLAVKAGARILSISHGVSDDAQIKKALQQADAAGVAVVKSAGNKGGSTDEDVTYIRGLRGDIPGMAAFPDLILVSGLSQSRANGTDLALWSGSSRSQAGSPQNRRVDIAAGAELIASLDHTAAGYNSVGSFGTSMAAPLVSSALQLVWSWTEQAAGEPAVAWRDRVIDMLLSGCVRDIGAAGDDDLFGRGSLDVRGVALFHSVAATGKEIRSTRPDKEPIVNGLYDPVSLLSGGMNPRWSPERRAIIYDVFNAPSGFAELRIQGLHPDRSLVGAPLAIARPAHIGMGAFDPLGGWICFLSKPPLSTGMDLIATTRDGNPANDVPLYSGGLLETPTFEPDGQSILLADTGSIIRVRLTRNPNESIAGVASTETVLSGSPVSLYYSTPAMSADGNRIALTVSNPAAGTKNIGSVLADGSNLTMHTNDGPLLKVANFGPGWTPDGSRVIFHSTERAFRPPGQILHRHRIRRAKTRVSATIKVLHDTGWVPVALPVGISGPLETLLDHSAVDVSKF